MQNISKCSLKEIENGIHQEPTNTILIQIVDIGMVFPKAYYLHIFEEIYQFKFMDFDIEKDFAISNTQAEDIANILINAKKSSHNVLVHCVMGVSRSGGVCEAAQSIGFIFNREEKLTLPNLLVKQKIIKNLYESTKKGNTGIVFSNANYYSEE